jgi:hypothetical protein
MGTCDRGTFPFSFPFTFPLPSRAHPMTLVVVSRALIESGTAPTSDFSQEAGPLGGLIRHDEYP